MKEGRLLMSGKERERKAILSSVKRGDFKLSEAAVRLGLSYRQTKRIYQRYRNEGDIGLIHRGRGQGSKNESLSDGEDMTCQQHSKSDPVFGEAANEK